MPARIFFPGSIPEGIYEELSSVIVPLVFLSCIEVYFAGGPFSGAIPALEGMTWTIADAVTALGAAVESGCSLAAVLVAPVLKIVGFFYIAVEYITCT